MFSYLHSSSFLHVSVNKNREKEKKETRIQFNIMSFICKVKIFNNNGLDFLLLDFLGEQKKKWKNILQKTSKYREQQPTY